MKSSAATASIPAPHVQGSRPRRVRRNPVRLQQIPVWAGFNLPATPSETDTGVERLLVGLNPEQRRAVVHGDGPMLIVAGAGTGKTEVITRRIAWLVATRRARPSQILGLTFTDKAAAEMQVRVDQLVPYGFADTAISTFHAFGDRLIREFAFELGISPDARVLSRAESVVLLREHLFELGLEAYLPLGDPTRFLGALVSLFGRCRDEDITPDRYQAYAASLSVEARTSAVTAAAGAATNGGDRATSDALLETAGRQREIATAYARYTDLLAANGAIDFGDQVALALRLLRASPATLATIRKRFRYILVDEFQDTNPVQSALVELLAEEHRNITVVGDDDQSIYRFRGAAISNILEFRDSYPGARTVVLRRNYRSTAPILDASHRLIRFNDPDRLESRVGISKKLISDRRPAAVVPIRVRSFETDRDEADWIAADIRRRIDGGLRPRDIAVLVRANAGADPILRSLNVTGIPWRFAGASGLYGRPEIRLLVSLLRAVTDPDLSADVYSLAASEVYGVPPDDLSAVMAAARRTHRSAWEVMNGIELPSEGPRLTGSGRAAIDRLVGDLGRLRELAHKRPAGEVLYAFLKGSGWLERMVAAASASSEEMLGNIAHFFDIVRRRSAVLADDRAVFLVPHLATLVEAGDDPSAADPDPDIDAVSILTVHKAKGLEFPVVFIPGLVAGRFPSATRRDPLTIPDGLLDKAATNGDPHLAEERRLFYVAMTRARDELILTHATDYGGLRARRISPFILEALDLPTSVTTTTGGAARPDPLERIATFAPTGAGVTPAGPGPIEGPLMLSHSSVDAYLSCPRRYHYSHVLRVPTAPHHSLVYGAALHQAVQEFHRAERRGVVMPQAELESVFERAWTNEGFVSREHEQARLAAGKATLRRFRDGQTAPGAVVPAWVERDFAFSLDGDRVRGRFDRVDIVPVSGSPLPDPAAAFAAASAPVKLSVSAAGADVIAPTLGIMAPEIVTITDYKSSDVRDPVKARQRTRESMQLQIYAMAYESMTGRLPDALQLHFLDSGLIGRVPVEPERLAKARDRIRTAATGIRARAYEARPETMACTYCPYREICPSSAAR